VDVRAGVAPLAGTYKVGRNLHFGTEHPANLAAAIELLDKTSAVWQRLAEGHPEVVGFRSDLAGFHAARGELELVRGQRRQALATYQQARDMWQQLALSHPRVPDYRVELASSEDRVGLICERYSRVEEAKASYRRSLELRQNLVAEFPKRPDYQLDLALAIMRLSRRGWSGPAAEAEAQLRHAQGILQKLVDQNPQVPAFRENLAISHSNLAQVLRRSDRLKEAETAWRLARSGYEKLAADFPALLHYHQQAAVYAMDLAAFFAHGARLEEAAALYDEAVQLMENVSQAAPQPAYRRQLATCHTEAAYVLLALGRAVDADKACRRALVLREKLLKDFHSVPVYHHELARLLALCPVPELRDQRRAIELARTNADAAPKALALAHYAAGNWAEVLEAMQRRQKLTSETTALDGFVMAVAHWRLGREPLARAWYAKAVQWMEMNQPDDPPLLHMRAEAGRVLGIVDHKAKLGGL
jgi:tetratricopeptide (TPR) repeat protein